MARPAEIAYFTDTSEMGGAEIYLLRLLERFDRERFRARLILGDDTRLAPMIDRARAADVPVVLVEKSRVMDCRSLWRLFRSLKLDLVHFNLPHPYACRPAFAAARAAGAALVATNHLPTINPRDYSWKGRAMLQVVNTLIDMTIVASEANRRLAMENYLLPADRLKTIGYGVDTRQFSPHVDGNHLRREFLESSEGLLVGTVGRLSPQKGHASFIEAAALVLSRFPTARFIIEGEGELRAPLAAQIRAMGLDGVIKLIGTRRDIPELMAALDIFVLTSTFEGLPLSLLEAMASSKAVVAPSIDGIPDAVEDGVTGRLVPPRDAGAVAEAIMGLLGNPALRRRMGEAGRRRVEREFTVERMVDRTEELYQSVLRQKGTIG